MSVRTGASDSVSYYAAESHAGEALLGSGDEPSNILTTQDPGSNVCCRAGDAGGSDKWETILVASVSHRQRQSCTAFAIVSAPHQVQIEYLCTSRVSLRELRMGGESVCLGMSGILDTRNQWRLLEVQS